MIRLDVAVCSTHVEMFPYGSTLGEAGERLLHACGDVSPGTYGSTLGESSAPRMWRCFHRYLRLDFGRVVCSTHVEMFPPESPWRRPSTRLLHACGDVSDSVGQPDN